MQKDDKTEEVIRREQKVKSLLTDVEYYIKKILNDERVILVSEDGKASALIHRNHMQTFYVAIAPNMENRSQTCLPSSCKTPNEKF